MLLSIGIAITFSLPFFCKVRQALAVHGPLFVEKKIFKSFVAEARENVHNKDWFDLEMIKGF